jgi:hypothetical protein
MLKSKRYNLNLEVFVFHVVSFLNRYARSVNAAHFHTSAKLNQGLDDVFNHLASGIQFLFVRKVSLIKDFHFLEMLKRKGGKEKAGGTGTKQKLVIVDTPEPKKSGGCC